MKQLEGVKKTVLLPIEEYEGLKDLQKKKMETPQPVGDKEPATIDVVLSKMLTILHSIEKVLLKVLERNLAWNKDGDLIADGKVVAGVNMPKIATNQLTEKTMTGGAGEEKQHLQQSKKPAEEKHVPPPPGEPGINTRKRKLVVEEEVIPKSRVKVSTSRWKTLT